MTLKSLIGTQPNQVPRCSDLGEMAFRSDPHSTVVTVVLTSSQSWSPPYPCVADIYVTGGGGTAALKASAYDGSTPGGTAGTAIKFGVPLSPNVAYTAAVGAPGAIPTSGTSGNAGSNSSFSGTGITTLTGNGGPAGQRVADSTGISGALYKTSGGSASGGDLNLSGGAGYIDVISTSTTIASSSAAAGTWTVMNQPSGDSFWGPGAEVAQAAINYGTGGPGTGSEAGTVYAAKGGVIVVQYQGAPS